MKQTIENQYPILATVPELSPLLKSADHVDVKVVEGAVSLNEFVAGMFSYYPGWMKTLYRIRWGFVRLLGMKQTGIPQNVTMRPTDLPQTAGEKAAFFTVELAEENRYWVASAAESHLTAYIGVIAEAVGSHQRFYVITIVHYHRWTGPVYFNVIRPFHHLVVNQMAQAGTTLYAPQLNVSGGLS